MSYKHLQKCPLVYYVQNCNSVCNCLKTNRKWRDSPVTTVYNAYVSFWKFQIFERLYLYSSPVEEKNIQRVGLSEYLVYIFSIKDPTDSLLICHPSIRHHVIWATRALWNIQINKSGTLCRAVKESTRRHIPENCNHGTWCVQVLRSPKEAFAAAMQSWRKRCEKCVCLQGDYVEKWLHFQLPVVSSFFK